MNKATRIIALGVWAFIGVSIGACILSVAMSGDIEHIEVEGSGAGINGRVMLRRGHTSR